MDRKFDIFAVIGMRMDWLSQRQKVVAGNFANADAPNYREGEAPRQSKRSAACRFRWRSKKSASDPSRQGCRPGRVPHSRGRGGQSRGTTALRWSRTRRPRAVPRVSERPWADAGNRTGAGSLKRNGRLWFKP